jgi:hypothetical protein
MKIKFVLVLMVVATALGSAIARAQTQYQAAQFAREGRALSASQAKELETRVADNPEDRAARTRLLGYYASTALRTIGAEATRDGRRRHILWFIQHHPESEATSLSEITIDPAGHALADADGYEQAKKAWLAQIDRHKDDVTVLLHAARFFRLPDRALTLDLLKRGVRLSGPNPNAARELGYVYGMTILGITMLNSNGIPLKADPDLAAGALAKQSIREVRESSNYAVVVSAGATLSQYSTFVSETLNGAVSQKALAEELLKKADAMNQTDGASARSLADSYHLRWVGAQTPQERASFARKELEYAELAANRSKANPEWYQTLLVRAAKAAVEAGEFEKAQQLANDALAQVGSRNDNTTGPVIHDAHVVLGRVDLAAGRVAGAKQHLLAAGRVIGGGSLTSFGPNMSLAKALLEHGERETVVKYLEECESFWSFQGTARQWITTIERGGIPNFGANLVY